MDEDMLLTNNLEHFSQDDLDQQEDEPNPYLKFPRPELSKLDTINQVIASHNSGVELLYQRIETLRQALEQSKTTRINIDAILATDSSHQHQELRIQLYQREPNRTAGKKILKVGKLLKLII